MMTEHPIPHTEAEDRHDKLRGPMRAAKELDRRVRDVLGGLQVVWAEHGQSRWFLLPSESSCPFSYRRCLCSKCEWVVGREPCYPSDVVRFFQSRHPREVTAWIPPPATCHEVNTPIPRGKHGHLQALMCQCPRCEESRGSAVDDADRVVQLGRLDQMALSHALWAGKPGTITLVYRHTMEKPVHVRYQPPYGRTLYELMGLPKPPARWDGFGKPSKRSAGEEEEEEEEAEERPPQRRVKLNFNQ